jgi:hypothetical protein
VAVEGLPEELADLSLEDELTAYFGTKGEIERVSVSRKRRCGCSVNREYRCMAC